MSTITETPQVRAEFWPTDAEDGVLAVVEATRDEGDPTRVAVYTFVNGEGSKTSYYLDREAAVQLATDLLRAVDLR